MKKTVSDASPHGMAGDTIRAARALNSEQRTMLKALAEGYDPYEGLSYRSFAHLSRVTGYKRPRVRVLVRQLARRGLAAYSKGLFNGDGEVAGSGYAVTTMGNIVAQIISED